VRILAVGLSLVLLATTARALTVRTLSLDELTAQAERIVHARCERVTVDASRPHLPVAEITLVVDETLKGVAADRLVIRQLAGRWNAIVPTCRPGDEVVLFLHAPSRAGLTSPVGLAQGYLRVERLAGAPAALRGVPAIVRALAVASGAAVAGGVDAAPLVPALRALRLRGGGPR
jgi:hypothetical protein